MAPVKHETRSIGINRYKPYESYPHLKPWMLSPSPSSLQGRDKEQVEKLPSLSPFSEHLTDFSNGADSDNDLDDCNAKTALEYYNRLHHTDYRVVRDNGFKCDDHIFDTDENINIVIIHSKFAAKSKRVVDGDSPAKLFFAELHRRKLEKDVVISCRILDGLTTGCSDCDELYHCFLDRRLKSFGPCDSYFDLESFMLSPRPSSIQGRAKGKIEMPPPSLCVEHLIDLSDGTDSDSDSDSDLDDWDDDNARAAVEYYNILHGTDYKVVRDNGFKCDEHIYCPNVIQRHLAIIHCKFAAKSKGAVDGDSPPKLFFAELYRRNIEKDVVFSCRILDGPTTGCSGCDISYHSILDSRLKPSGRNEEAEAEKRRYDATILNMALAYYNGNHHEEYELVGDSEVYMGLELKLAIHCNFRAKRKSGCGNETSLPKLFFAELEKTGDVWEVCSCVIIDGRRTIAGCYMCYGRSGKKIQHPACELRNGFYDEVTGRTFIDDASNL